MLFFFEIVPMKIFRCPIVDIVKQLGQRPKHRDVPKHWQLEIVRARASNSMSMSKCGTFLRLEHLTPCRTPDERRFGSFRCVECKRTWCSANSWMDAWQRCVQCNVKVYPYQQDALQRDDDDDAVRDNDEKPHQTELCGRCQKLGHSCVVRR